jgi:glucose/arabinose dehydrogenase
MLFKSKKLIILAVILIIVGVLVYVNYAYNIPDKGVERGRIVSLIPTPVGTLEVDLAPVDYDIVEVVRGLDTPWSMAFTSPERMLVSERRGTIRQIVNGNLSAEPLITLGETAEVSESGLMGITVHPNYQSNKYVYACLTYETENGLSDKIERFVDNGDSLSRDRVILDSFPAARFHAGCRIKFGPDGKLYVTTGDATVRDDAQKTDSMSGKILRMNDDGTVPGDNPFGDLFVWSYGHRNPQGIAWHESGVMFETEHGPSGNDGPGGGDEVNIIKKGLNYGWPIVSHERSLSGMEDPKLVFTPAEAPAGATFYTGDVFPQFKNNFFFTALRGAGVFRVVVNDENPEEIMSYEKLDIDLGRIRDIVEGPDGLVYFATSNRDGRGVARDGDDKIYRFEPR